MQHTDQEHKIRGKVQRVLFRNPANGYTVLEVELDGGERLTVVGTCLDVQPDIDIEAVGHYKVHPKFGRQLVSNSISLVGLSSEEGIERYLGSGIIKGIGKGLAKKIVDEFGKDTYEVICKDPDKLAAIPGIGRKKAKVISDALSEQGASHEIVRFLVEHKISPILAEKIYRRYGERAMFIITSNPYRLARDIKGIGFRKADAIALGSMGFSPESPQRLQAGLFYALENATDDGHCFLPRHEVLERATYLLDLPPTLGLTPHLDEMILAGELLEVDSMVYLPWLCEAEDFVARFIADRVPPLKESPISDEQVEASTSLAEASLNIEFSPEQSQAVRDAARHRLMIITGGPGCGKTTLIKALSLLFREAGFHLALAAPTGRAAQRMSQVCGMPASTIHRLLKFQNGQFVHGISEPLPIDALIVDEASMIDVGLASSLFSAILPNTFIIMVGDMDQLPSVGPGRVFADLIAANKVKSVRLSRLFRRAEESLITTIAHTINSGEVPPIPEPDGVTKADAYFISKPEPDAAVTVIEKLVSDQLPKKFGIEISDIMVLSPSNRGPLGTITLNERLQARLNPAERHGRRELVVGDTAFRLGDKVCQRVNNYGIKLVGGGDRETEVYNGDIGTVSEVYPHEKRMIVELWDGRRVIYSASELGQLGLAYAMTVHRSQGTEIPCVVLALHESHYALLQRQLVYTAVTRAKKLLIVVGSKKALAIAAKRATTSERCTMLAEKIFREIHLQGP